MTNYLEEYMRASVSIRQHAKMSVPGFDYLCFEDYVLQKGALMNSSALTEEEEEIVLEALSYARGLGADVHEQNQCFANAQALLLVSREPAFTYYEGYAGRTGFPIHHGWLGINGKVIDLTWTLEEPDMARKVLPRYPVGELPKDYMYWGVPFTNQDYMRFRITTREIIGSLLDDLEGGFPLLRGINPNDEDSWMELAAEIERAG